MDGYHYTRAQLDAMPDPATAHARRGAEFTFDGEAFYHLVKRLKEPLTRDTPTIYAPSFDHAIKDPKENDIAVERTHRVVVLEGNCKSPLEYLIKTKQRRTIARFSSVTARPFLLPPFPLPLQTTIPSTKNSRHDLCLTHCLDSRIINMDEQTSS